jgi:hypothetical protein
MENDVDNGKVGVTPNKEGTASTSKGHNSSTEHADTTAKITDRTIVTDLR